MANISINPMLVTTAAGSFSIRSTGYVQGTAMDDPAVRYALTGGQLAATEPLPIWGGCAIHDRIPTSSVPDLGGSLSRSNAVDGAANIAGFSVFNQAYAWISTPQSPVPMASALMTVPFYRLGSGARIVVKADPAMVTLQGNYTNSKVSWDFNDQMLVPFTNAYPQLAITNAVYAGGNITYTTASAHGIAVGTNFNTSGFAPAGYNGNNWHAITGTAGSTLVTAAPNPGVTPATTMGVLLAGGGQLICNVLDILVGNCKTVIYDPVTGFATWDSNGTAALILI
jgi:hypothetical protein